MIQENSVRNLTKCAIIEDSAWTGWEDSECKGGHKVEGYLCGAAIAMLGHLRYTFAPSPY